MVRQSRITLNSWCLNEICAWSKSLSNPWLWQRKWDGRSSFSPIRFSEQFQSFISSADSSLLFLTKPLKKITRVQRRCEGLQGQLWLDNSFWNKEICSEIWQWLIRLSFSYFCVSFKCVQAAGCSPVWPITSCSVSLVVFSISLARFDNSVCVVFLCRPLSSGEFSWNGYLCLPHSVVWLGTNSLYNSA